MRYFLIAGEASGDLHGSNLMRAIKQSDSNAVFAFWGGDAMQNEYKDGLLTHYRDINIMGFIEVIKNLGRIRNNLKRCKEDIISFQPDIIIFIDFPGFNLRMASFAKQNGYKTAYYIAPKIWAWNEKRGKKLEKYIDLLLLIFPFEKEYFKKWQVNSLYVGNPLIDEIESNTQETKPIKSVLLMPGSRKQEIKSTLPTMLYLAKLWPHYQFQIAGAPGIDAHFYNAFNIQSNVEIKYNQTYALLKEADVAIVCSGTATLETALFGVPQICVYKGNKISIFIAKILVKIKYISLVNIILNKAAIPELIQENFTLSNIETLTKELLSESERVKKQLDDYRLLREMLGENGAAERAAQAIIALVNQKQ